MRCTLLMLLLLGPGALLAADTYTWVDENNERHWSDTPHPGAQKIELTPQNVVRMPPPPPTATAAPRGTAAQPGYDSCAIVAPTPDQVFFDVQTITISVQLAPGLHAGDTVTATLDGSDVPTESAAAMQFTASPVYRGTHVAAAVVRDSSGRTLCTAPSVTFHVRQHAIGARPRPAPH
jgi:hypothetical protein